MRPKRLVHAFIVLNTVLQHVSHEFYLTHICSLHHIIYYRPHTANSAALTFRTTLYWTSAKLEKHLRAKTFTERAILLSTFLPATTTRSLFVTTASIVVTSSMTISNPTTILIHDGYCVIRRHGSRMEDAARALPDDTASPKRDVFWMRSVTIVQSGCKRESTRASENPNGASRVLCRCNQ